jgi:hypothetical protein
MPHSIFDPDSAREFLGRAYERDAGLRELLRTSPDRFALYRATFGCGCFIETITTTFFAPKVSDDEIINIAKESVRGVELPDDNGELVLLELRELSEKEPYRLIVPKAITVAKNEPPTEKPLK